MSCPRIHAAVARATGDSLRSINRIGFSHMPDHVRDEVSPGDPLTVIDCPCCGGTVVLSWDRAEALPEFADCRRCETIIDYHPWEVYRMRLDDIEIPMTRSYVPAA